MEERTKNKKQKVRTTRAWVDHHWDLYKATGADHHLQCMKKFIKQLENIQQSLPNNCDYLPLRKTITNINEVE